MVDIDVAALDNCVMNLELNDHNDYNTNKQVILRDRFKPQDETYDLTFANILQDVLILEKKLLLNTLKPSGYLIVSGLLNEQVDTIVSEYASLECVQVSTKNDWSCVLFKK